MASRTTLVFEKIPIDDPLRGLSKRQLHFLHALRQRRSLTVSEAMVETQLDCQRAVGTLVSNIDKFYARYRRQAAPFYRDHGTYHWTGDERELDTSSLSDLH